MSFKIQQQHKVDMIAVWSFPPDPRTKIVLSSAAANRKILNFVLVLMVEYPAFIFPLCHDLGRILSRLFISSSSVSYSPSFLWLYELFFFFFLYFSPHSMNVLGIDYLNCNSLLILDQSMHLFFFFCFWCALCWKGCSCSFNHEEGIPFSKNSLHHVFPKYCLARWGGGRNF